MKLWVEGGGAFKVHSSSLPHESEESNASGCNVSSALKGGGSRVVRAMTEKVRVFVLRQHTCSFSL